MTPSANAQLAFDQAQEDAARVPWALAVLRAEARGNVNLSTFIFEMRETMLKGTLAHYYLALAGLSAPLPNQIMWLDVNLELVSLEVAPGAYGVVHIPRLLAEFPSRPAIDLINQSIPTEDPAPCQSSANPT